AEHAKHAEKVSWFRVSCFAMYDLVFRLDRERESHRRPVAGGGRYELILAVREAAFEVLLNRKGARADEPRSVGQLRFQQVCDAALVKRIGDGDRTAFR